MFQRILVATDLLPAAAPMLVSALQFGRERGAHLWVVHVIEKPSERSHWLSPLFDEELTAYESALQRETESARRLVGDSIGAAGGQGADTEVVVRTGRAADTIVAIASELDAELIVLGHRGREGSLGSVAERVLRTAHRPVLVLTPRAG